MGRHEAEREKSKRRGDVNNNQGWCEIVWSDVGEAAKWGWARMLDSGREDTIEEKMATRQEKIARDRKTPWTVSS
ncbi:hypothetical protein, partial [Salmonella enterica]|uniref:hypothetical protein n=1 Tax=Salmonella enterica TaxID=28901 RepID=UPI00398C55E3